MTTIPARRLGASTHHDTTDILAEQARRYRSELADAEAALARIRAYCVTLDGHRDRHGQDIGDKLRRLIRGDP